MADALPQMASHGWLFTHGNIATLVVILLPLLFLLKKLVFPRFDPREPTVVRSRIPLIGHLISLARERTSFFRRLYRETRLPICTLPILNGKMYIISSPGLIAAAMRNQYLSFIAMSLDISKNLFQLSDKHMDIFSQPGFADAGYGAIHASLAGDNLKSMIDTGLTAIAASLNGIQPNPTLNIPNTYKWIEELMFLSLMVTLYGKNSPITLTEMQTFWDFEKCLSILALNLAPNLIARPGVAARSRLQSIIDPFYRARHDHKPDVSAFIRHHADFLRSHGIPDEELSQQEFMIPFAAITASIPTAFWITVQMLSQPEWVSRARDEIETATTIASNASGGRIASISASKLQNECPALSAFWQETTRVYSDNIGVREVVQDTLLQDPESGKEYLLTKGTKVQWASSVVQLNETTWGPNADTFEPARWLNMSPKERQSCRKSMIPFGGGKVLCPGRVFAEVKILGFVSGMLLCFDVDGVQVPESQNPNPGVPMRNPAWGETDPAVEIKRRPGWEDVELQFVP